MNNISAVMKNVGGTLKKHSPEILTGIGVLGMCTATGMAIRATPKALLLIEQEKRRQNYELLQEAKATGSDVCQVIDKLKPMEVVKATWKCYIPSFTICLVSVLCIVGASSQNLKRNAALATAYTLSESALKEYQEKVIEEVGEKKEQAVRDAIAKDKVEAKPVVDSEVVITDRGETLCFDVMSGRYFKSDIDKLKKAENELNRQMRSDEYISLNEFYYEIGLDGIKLGDDIGWNIDRGYIDLEFSSQLTKDGKPCLVLGYSVAPRYDYR